MSQRDRSGLLNVQISDTETQDRWQQARDQVASELGTDPSNLSRWEVARELSEAYTGGDSLGRWREDDR